MRGFGQVREAPVMRTQVAPQYAPSDAPMMMVQTANAAPACLTSAQAIAIVQWMANPVGAPPVPPEVLGLPFCPGEPPLTLPACRDAVLDGQIAYCAQYPLGDGPNANFNGTCWLASKDVGWYDALKSLPPCAGNGGEEEGGKKMMVWGGILLAVLVVGGGAYLYAKGKKKKK